MEKLSPIHNGKTIPKINEWSVEDRPREKLILRGKAALTNAELLAIIIGSGNRNESAVGLMQRILQDCGNDLNALGKRSVDELMRFKGIGSAKAISLVAMSELGRRRHFSSSQTKPLIKSSEDAYNIVKGDLQDLQHEEFWVLMLNRAGKMIKKDKISAGGLSATVVDPKIIFKKSLDSLASSIILVHNHPSGNTKPSKQDISLTRQLIHAGKVLEIIVHDHIIVGDNNYYSFADEGNM